MRRSDDRSLTRWTSPHRPAPSSTPRSSPSPAGRLAVDGLHTLYFEQSGNAQGVPVVVLHGGPGAGSSPSHRRFFDPAFYRIVVFDQRGAGRSTPHGELRDNTTQHLIADLEALRRQLGIERWLLFGGSWGSTLALAYAQTHPQRCLGLVLRGIFLCRRHEIDWFLYGMRTIFPEDWRALAEHIPAAERNDLLDAYWRRLDDPDSAVRVAAARAWSRYEGACSTLLPNADAVAYFASDRVALGLARIEAHYFRHQRVPGRRRAARPLGALAVAARSDRAGTLRYGVPDRDRRRAASGVAGSAVHRGARCRSLGLGAGHPRRAGVRHRAPQARAGALNTQRRQSDSQDYRISQD